METASESAEEWETEVASRLSANGFQRYVAVFANDGWDDFVDVTEQVVADLVPNEADRADIIQLLCKGVSKLPKRKRTESPKQTTGTHTPKSKMKKQQVATPVSDTRSEQSCPRDASSEGYSSSSDFVDVPVKQNGKVGQLSHKGLTKLVETQTSLSPAKAAKTAKDKAAAKAKPAPKAESVAKAESAAKTKPAAKVKPAAKETKSKDAAKKTTKPPKGCPPEPGPKSSASLAGNNVPSSSATLMSSSLSSSSAASSPILAPASSSSSLSPSPTSAPMNEDTPQSQASPIESGAYFIVETSAKALQSLHRSTMQLRRSGAMLSFKGSDGNLLQPTLLQTEERVVLVDLADGQGVQPVLPYILRVCAESGTTSASGPSRKGLPYGVLMW